MGIVLMSRDPSQQRLDGFPQTQHSSDFLRTLPVRIICPRAQAFNDYFSRRTQQYHVIELGEKLPLFGAHPTQEQHVGVLDGEQS